MKGEIMDREEIIKDFKSFLNTNREKLRDVTIEIKDLPTDDEWIQDDEWDEIYKQEVLKDGKV
jgi:hypothetical protein